MECFSYKGRYDIHECTHFEAFKRKLTWATVIKSYLIKINTVQYGCGDQIFVGFYPW